MVDFLDSKLGHIYASLSMPLLIDDIPGVATHRPVDVHTNFSCHSPTPHDRADRIVDILASYRLVTAISRDQTWDRRERVSAQVLKAVQSNCPIRMVLLGFPFKSPNKEAKVFTVLPDKADEIALKHLNGLCSTIAGIHSPGARLDIVSDGLMYNDLLGVDDEEVWEYSVALQKLARDVDCKQLRFVHFAELLEEDKRKSGGIEESYVPHASAYRDMLVEKYTPADFDIDAFVKKDEPTTLRYRGCIKFLEKDLELAPWLADMSKNQKKKRMGVIAKSMLLRGECFAAAVAAKFGTHIRLSVHASGSEAVKLSVALLPQSGGHETTPWHNVLIREVNGSMSMSHKECVQLSTHETVDENGRPSYCRAKSELYDWPDMAVSFDYLYPCGIIIQPADVASKHTTLQFVHMQKILGLAEQCSPVVLRGFTFAPGYEMHGFDGLLGGVNVDAQNHADSMLDGGSKSNGESKSSDANESKLGDGTFSRDTDREGHRGKSNGTMTHGKKVHGKVTGGKIHQRFQLFKAPMQAPGGSSQMVFVSSRLFFQHLPPKHSEEELGNLTWICRKPDSEDTYIEKEACVVKHPSHDSPCIRLPDSIPVGITKLAAGDETGEEVGGDYVELLDTMVNDRRVFTEIELRSDDVVVSDKFNASHIGTVLQKREGEKE